MELLSSLFSEDELRQFIRFGPRGELIAQISERSSRKQMAIEIVELLARRGEIDDDFFERLVCERPQRDAEIRAVARRLSVVAGASRGVRRADRARLLWARRTAVLLVLAVAAVAGWEFGRRDESVVKVAASGGDSAGVPGPLEIPSEERAVVVPSLVDSKAGESRRAETAKGTPPAAPALRSRALTEDALLGKLAQNRGALTRCAEQYYRLAGEPIPEGKYWVRFSLDSEGRLRVGAPSEGLLSVGECFEAALKTVEASRWRPGSADVRLDLHRIVSVVQG